MLDIQYNLYSVDTGNFYSNHEKYLHDMNCKYRRERNYVNNKSIQIFIQLIFTDLQPKGNRDIMVSKR